MELFDVYHQKDKVLVVLQQKNREPISFMVQGILKPETKKKKQNKAKQKLDKSSLRNTHETEISPSSLPIKSKPSAL